MDKNKIQYFKKILKNWKNQLKKKKYHTDLYQHGKPINFPDPVDRAVQEEEFSLTLRHQERKNKIIKKIDITLNKIKNNTFGYCELCDIEIGIKRLEARPTANLCIDCKTLAEIRKKQKIGSSF